MQRTDTNATLPAGHPRIPVGDLPFCGPPVSPWSVKRAIAYIRANLDLPITIADLVAASGVPGRTLFHHFRAFAGMSPMRYLQERRFDETRRALLSASPGTTVTSIAWRCGFSHMGRFAVDYRRRFGESPSATLAMARRDTMHLRQATARPAQRHGRLPGSAAASP